MEKTIGEYKDGYSITAAPLIVKDLVITGVAGGEFGIVGKVEARDPKLGKLYGQDQLLKDTWVI